MSIVPASIGYQHVVSSGHELASYAAFEVLENGGNAVDAGVAAILALGVLYSDQVSVAGVAPMVIRSGSTGEIVTITGLGYWPRGLDIDDYISRHEGQIPSGVRRTVVPAAPDACLQALERFGMQLQDAIEAPRLITHSHPDSFAPHNASPGRITIEGRVSENTCNALADRGHKLERLADWTHGVAGVCAVKKDLKSGRITGGADPRRMSRAMGH